MVRVVLDANVIVSAAFGGIPHQALGKAFRQTVFISPLIKKELLLLPQELSSKLAPDQVFRMRKMLRMLLYKATLCVPKTKISLCRDPKDDMYLSLCHDVQADYLITGDRDLLALSCQQLVSVGLNKLKILTPKKFLQISLAA